MTATAASHPHDLHQEFFKVHNISATQYFNEFNKYMHKLKVLLKSFDFIDSDTYNEEIEFINKYIENVKSRVNHIANILNHIRYRVPYDNQSADEFIEEHLKEVKKVLAKDFMEAENAKNLENYKKKLESKLIQEI